MASPEETPAGDGQQADQTGQTEPRFTLASGAEDAEGMLLMPIIAELNAMDADRPPSSGSPYD